MFLFIRFLVFILKTFFVRKIGVLVKDKKHFGEKLFWGGKSAEYELNPFITLMKHSFDDVSTVGKHRLACHETVV